MYRYRILLGVLALALVASTARATVLLTAPTTSGSLTCNPNTGAVTAVAVTVKAASVTGGSVVASVPVVPTGLTVALSGTGTIATNTVTLTTTNATAIFTFTPQVGCGYMNTVTYPQTVNFRAVQGGTTNVADQTYSATVTAATGGSTPLVMSPSSVTLTCIKAGSYTAGPNVAFTVASSLASNVGGTAVAADTSSFPSWLSTTADSTLGIVRDSGAGVMASGATTVAFHAHVEATACSGAIGSSRTASVRFTDPPGTTYQTLAVTLTVVGAAPLTLNSGLGGAGSASGTPLTFAYTKTQPLPSATVLVKAPALQTLYFAVDTTGLPAWLTVDRTSGQATSTGLTLTFTVTHVADALVAGVYTPTSPMSLKVAGYADTPLYLQLTVSNPAATLSVVEGQTRNLSWGVGQLMPSAVITAISNGAPIPFTVTIAAGSPDAGATVTPAGGGLAYSFGTVLDVTFDPLIFAGAQPGSVLTSTITLHWGASQTTAIVFSVNIQAPSSTAIITGITPSSLPNAPGGTSFTVNLYGSGFVSSTDPTQKTTVGVVSGGTVHPLSYMAANVVSGATIILTITVPATPDAYMPFATANSVVTLGVCNPGGTSCTTATGSTTLTIDSGPVIYTNGVTSASTFVPVNATTGALAPYDIISIFGNNFCVSGGTGCTGNQPIYPIVTNDLYANALTPDTGVGARNLQVWFYNHGSTTAGPASGSPVAAPILFATNNQINVVVPSGIVSTTHYDIMVKFNNVASPAYEFIGAATNPGVFVVDANNYGAVILPNGAITNTNANAARMRTSGTNSDWVSIFLTGLGTPAGGSAANTSGGGNAYPADCLSAANFAAAAGQTVLDGVVLDTNLLYPGRNIPCFDPASYLTVKIANKTLTPMYAGFANDAIAGLYQINVKLPAKGAASMQDMQGNALTLSAGTPAQVPVVVAITGGSVTSQGLVSGQYQVGMKVQAAQTFTGTPTATFTVGALAAAGTTPVALGTVTTDATVPTFALSVLSAPTGVVAGWFDTTTTTIKISHALAAGTYVVGITSSDAGGLPDESLVWTFTVS